MRVIEPARLALEIFREIEQARPRHMPRMVFDAPRMASDPRHAKLTQSATRWHKSAS